MRFSLTFFAAIIITLVTALSCKHSKQLRFINANVEKDSTLTLIDSSIVLKYDTVKIIDSVQLEFAEKLNVPFDSINDIKLYQFIKNNLGKKCFGIKSPDFTCESFLTTLIKNVYDIDFPATIEQQMLNKNVELFKNNNFLKQGDLLFFNYSEKQKERITHVGFYLQNGFFLLASYKEGVVITKLQNGFWNKRFVAAGRYTLISSTKTKLVVSK
jgi:NlpC/P60 family